MDRDAMAAQSWTWIEGHITKRLGLGGINDLPDVDAHRAVDHLQFVHQSNIDATEYILQELGRLGHSARGHGHNALHRPAVKILGFIQARGRIASDYLGDLRDLAGRVAWILPFR